MPLLHLEGVRAFYPTQITTAEDSCTQEVHFLFVIILANDVIILANERFKAVEDVLSLMWVLGVGEEESTKSHYF